MLTEKLMHLTLLGGSEWVMVLLLVLSVVSISVMVERAFFFARQRKQVQTANHPVLQTAHGVARQTDQQAASQLVSSALGRERLRLEQRLGFLGTLGNNAPFIGLFGTVLGIIRAFHDLSVESLKGANAVMAGISESLVATAVGLFVAIPAVIAFNYFQRQSDQILSHLESLAQEILAVTKLKSTSQGSVAGDG